MRLSIIAGIFLYFSASKNFGFFLTWQTDKKIEYFYYRNGTSFLLPIRNTARTPEAFLKIPDIEAITED